MTVKTDYCACDEPVVVVSAERKGAAASRCARCGLPVRIAFNPR